MEHGRELANNQYEHFLEPFLAPAPVVAVISGPSGVGKDSVIKRLREQNDALRFVVTCTNRAIRPGEVDGQDYYFISTQEFERMIAAGEMLEYASVYGQYKGVARARIREALTHGVDVLLRLDVQGAATVKALVPQCVTIFIAPPSQDALLQRLRMRGGDTEAQVERRLQTAMSELARANSFDYVVINHQDHLDRTVAAVQAIILATKCRTGRQPAMI